MKPHEAHREEALFAEVRAPLERHQVQSSNVLEVTPVEGGELAAALPGGRGHDQVVVARHLPGRLGLRPNARVFPRYFIRVGDDREECEHCF